jgi:hypothetical protein
MRTAAAVLPRRDDASKLVAAMLRARDQGDAETALILAHKVAPMIVQLREQRRPAGIGAWRKADLEALKLARDIIEGETNNVERTSDCVVAPAAQGSGSGRPEIPGTGGSTRRELVTSHAAAIRSIAFPK